MNFGKRGLIGTLLMLQVLMYPEGDGGGDGSNGGGGGGGQGGSGRRDGDRGNRDGDKVFTQDELNKIVQDRINEERRRGNIRPEEREELTRLKDEAAARAVKDAEAQRNYEEAKKSLETGYQAKLTAAEQAQQRLRDRLEDVTIRQSIESIAAKSVHDASEVSTLLRTRVKLNDDLVPVVVKADGKTIEHVNGEPMTVEQLVTSFLARPDKKHLLRATQSKPAGSGEGDSTSDEGGAGDDADSKELKALKDDYDAKFKAAQNTSNPTAITTAVTAERKYKTKLDEINKKKKG